MLQKGKLFICQAVHKLLGFRIPLHEFLKFSFYHVSKNGASIANDFVK